VNEQIVIALVTIFFFGNVAWIVWLLVGAVRRTKMARAQAEVQSKLIDKFGSSQELLAYMQTEAGQRFIQVESEPVVTKSPHAKILGSITVGTILACLGLGLLLLSVLFEDDVPLGFGTIALAIGLGFLISSGVSYRLSKSWGLFDREATEANQSE
jgi:hypothetical protein